MTPPSELAKSILSELAYFDIFEHPLTPIELWRFAQTRETTLADVITELEQSGWLKERIGQKWGLYFLRGREHVVELRLVRYRESEAKYQKALRFAGRLAAFPFVKMIAVCNSLAYSNSRFDGDIDLFIVTAPGRIWTTRWFVTSYLKLLGERPTKTNTRDKICASFFVTPEAFDLRLMRIAQSDIYLAHWIAQLVPIYDPHSLYRKFFAANDWTKEVYPNLYPMNPPAIRRVAPNWFRRVTQRKGELFYLGSWGDFWERAYERIQRRILPPDLRRLADRDTRVVLSPTMLKFHENDRRAMYQQRWFDKCKELGA